MRDKVNVHLPEDLHHIRSVPIVNTMNSWNFRGIFCFGSNVKSDAIIMKLQED